jgi:RNA polymerase sigma-70 factor (ECF subfamily)
LNDSTDTQLVTRLHANDVDAFDFLYLKYHKPLYSYILRFLKIPELAEDVLQEVFLKIWDVRHRINPDLSFNAYLYRISRNLVFKQLKKIASDDELLTQVTYELKRNVEDADVRLLWSEYEKMLQDAIGQLPPQRQKIFKLCRQEGKSYEEVASELHISRNTVKEHMVLGTKFLKEFIYSNYKVEFIVILTLLLHNTDINR